MVKKGVSPYLLRTVLTGIGLVMVVLSALFSNDLARRMREEEQKRMELWAEATRQLITADEDANLDFLLTIIENNTTIPVYMTDSAGQCLMHRNVRNEAEVDKRVAKLRESQQPIEVKINENTMQYIYYENSTLLTLLTWYPYINLAVVLVFMTVALLFVFTVQEAQQDRVWAGLSKETAHQLGTPISSLNAWHEILKTTYPNDAMIPEMDADLKRLTVIADRFQKVGSMPELTETDLSAVLNDTLSYMRKRTSARVEIELETSPITLTTSEPQGPWLVKANAALLSWVIENLLRNAVDAMDGSGKITVTLSRSGSRVCIDVADTGKGIPRRDWRRIFQPGYTTKERGWGMGLSLSKRIIEVYHHGKIYVLRSTVGQGSTLRVEIP